ncbi:MAG: hypothetical protein ACP5RP_00575 [Candidatus Micrarchaeia archaeon]
MSFYKLKILMLIAAIVVVGAFAIIKLGLIQPAYASSTNSITASVTVLGTCYISTSPNSINFGNLATGANTPTNSLVTVSDPGGNAAANVLVEGTNWASGSNSFGVSNTTWSATAQTTYSGTALSNTLTNTGIVVPAPTPSTTTTSNSIYFGVQIPTATVAGTYTQTITIENSC